MSINQQEKCPFFSRSVLKRDGFRGRGSKGVSGQAEMKQLKLTPGHSGDRAKLAFLGNPVTRKQIYYSPPTSMGLELELKQKDWVREGSNRTLYGKIYFNILKECTSMSCAENGIN